jgi:predicted Zn-dependent protease
MATVLESTQPKLLDDRGFLLTYIKVLIEADGPTYKIRSLLNRGMAMDGAAALFQDYVTVVDAMDALSKGPNDPGEVKLKALISRSPDNVQALFVLGAHLFWVQKQPTDAARYLEKCVKLRPNFLRAWGCLGSIYESLGNHPLAFRAYQKCQALETDPQMKSFFVTKLKAVG